MDVHLLKVILLPKTTITIQLLIDVGIVSGRGVIDTQVTMLQSLLDLFMVVIFMEVRAALLTSVLCEV